MERKKAVKLAKTFINVSSGAFELHVLAAYAYSLRLSLPICRSFATTSATNVRNCETLPSWDFVCVVLQTPPAAAFCCITLTQIKFLDT